MTSHINKIRSLYQKLLCGFLLLGTLSPVAFSSDASLSASDLQAIHPKIEQLLELDDSQDISVFESIPGYSYSWMLAYAKDTGHDPVEFYTLLQFLYREAAVILDRNQGPAEDNDELHNVVLRMASYLNSRWHPDIIPTNCIDDTTHFHPIFDSRRGMFKGLPNNEQRKQVGINLLLTTLLSGKPILVTSNTGSVRTKSFMIGPVHDPATGATKIVTADYSRCPTWVPAASAVVGRFFLDGDSQLYSSSPAVVRPESTFILPDCARKIDEADYLLGSDADYQPGGGLVAQLIEYNKVEWSRMVEKRFSAKVKIFKFDVDILQQLFNENGELLNRKVLEIIDGSVVDGGAIGYQETRQQLNQLVGLLGKHTAAEFVQYLEMIAASLQMNPDYAGAAERLAMVIPFYTLMIDGVDYVEQDFVDNEETYREWLSRSIDRESVRVNTILNKHLAKIMASDWRDFDDILEAAMNLTESHPGKSNNAEGAYKTYRTYMRVKQYHEVFAEAGRLSTDAGVALTALQSYLVKHQDELPDVWKTRFDTEMSWELSRYFNRNLVVGGINVTSRFLEQSTFTKVVDKAMQKTPEGLDFRMELAHRTSTIINIDNVNISQIYRLVGMPISAEKDQRHQAKQRVRSLLKVLHPDKTREDRDALEYLTQAGRALSIALDYLRTTK